MLYSQILNNGWKLATDPRNIGRAERWFEQAQPGALDTSVPSVIQQTFPAYHGVAWYWTTFTLDLTMTPDDRLIIHFGAVDYYAEVWVNGARAGDYEGGETPFEFDITATINASGDNVLAVRVLNPTNEPIDGFVLAETPHRNKVVPARAGSPFNSGGIMYPVELHVVPTLSVRDVFVRPDPATGDITVAVTVSNASAAAVSGALAFSVAGTAGGDVWVSFEQSAVFPSGESAHTAILHIAQPRLWALDDPYLYSVTTMVTTPAQPQNPHTYTVRCGFRDFRLVDGFFHLNGKRVFVKSTHTGNCMPIGQQVAVIPDLVRRDFINAKASGFNMVRFIAGVAYPEQLDFCDEIGLMVYEECFAAWVLQDSPHLAQRYAHSTLEMIRRDRNHPCVTMWGLLNETMDSPTFEQALGFLPQVRREDPTRLVLLNSGRFDNRLDVGSASNPSGEAWEYVWGDERPDGPHFTGLNHPSHDGTGDYHFYPPTPQTRDAGQLIRGLGAGTKPVFLSEYGIGSMMDVIREWRHFQQVGARPDLEDSAWLQEQSEAFVADWHRLGFDGVYPFAEDLLRESQRLHARQRTLGFDLLRSNPQINGYNLTGMLDHAITGEGLWNFWREWKPATFDAVADGWAPLRWCLFVDPLHTYTGKTITVEAVLANEGVMRPGTYPARFRVCGPTGIVWDKVTEVHIPDPAPLATPVLRETITLAGPAGAYVFAANLEAGGAPSGGRLTFHVSDAALLPQLDGQVDVWGLGSDSEAWLTRHGLTCAPFVHAAPATDGVVLVGAPDDAESNPALWQRLTQRMDAGATVVFLNAALFANGKAAMDWLPLQNKGRCYRFNDWLYHKECVAKRHPVFDALPGPGIMDWDYYAPIIPQIVFEEQDTPDEVMAAAFASGYYAYPRAYGSSLLLVAYRHGPGRFMLNTFNLLENLDQHPAADRMMLNLVRTARINAGRGG